jgi:carboxylate-amine ligase
VTGSLQRILSQGTGATRQRQAYKRNGRLADVVAHATGITHQEPADHYPLGEPFLDWDAETANASCDSAAISG